MWILAKSVQAAWVYFQDTKSDWMECFTRCNTVDDKKFSAKENLALIMCLGNGKGCKSGLITDHSEIRNVAIKLISIPKKKINISNELLWEREIIRWSPIQSKNRCKHPHKFLQYSFLLHSINFMNYNATSQAVFISCYDRQRNAGAAKQLTFRFYLVNTFQGSMHSRGGFWKDTLLQRPKIFR
jgi:hypothetical protein